ncbi:hypothetical protein [Streptomyces sp. NPDC046371]|uniref:hypothetical protein n=1 Tax=Streptomyces sp. NPDC046371 TaxID=3154916 RepID=UPI0033DD232D
MAAAHRLRTRLRATGLYVRQLGGVIFGHFGDRIDRKGTPVTTRAEGPRLRT